MIFAEQKNYRSNLNFCYDRIAKIEHLGVADKFLMRLRFDKIIEAEYLAEEISHKNYHLTPHEKISAKDERECYDFAINRLGTQIFEEVFAKEVNYF